MDDDAWPLVSPMANRNLAAAAGALFGMVGGGEGMEPAGPVEVASTRRPRPRRAATPTGVWWLRQRWGRSERCPSAASEGTNGRAQPHHVGSRHSEKRWFTVIHDGQNESVREENRWARQGHRRAPYRACGASEIP